VQKMKLKKEEKIYLLVQFIILLGIPLAFTLFVERVYGDGHYSINAKLYQRSRQ